MTFYVSCLCSIVEVHHADLEQGVFMWQKQGNRLPFGCKFMLVINGGPTSQPPLNPYGLVF
jgi:hypothetical protein